MLGRRKEALDAYYLFRKAMEKMLNVAAKVKLESGGYSIEDNLSRRFRV
jgi:hypothetical protein